MHIEKGVHGNKRERAKDNKKGIQQCAVATADLYNTSTTLDVVHLVLALRHTMVPCIDCCSKYDFGLYMNIQNIHLGLGFEFGPQKLGIKPSC